MTFVTVGNATHGFRRLLEAVESLKANGLLGNEPVFIQSGNAPDFRSHYCEHRPFLSIELFQQWMDKADIIISHGGCGTLLHAVRLGKVPVVMPRRKKYGEHVNDHQLQLVQALTSEGRIIPAYEPEDLPAAIAESRHRNAQPVPPPPSQMISLVSQAIEELVCKR